MSRALQSLFWRVHRQSRGQRAELFRRHLRPSPQDRILDVGGGYGDYFSTVVPFRENVWIAEIDAVILQRAREHGFQTALISTDGSLPFPDRHFDIVHCNSVVEHVLVPEDRARLAAEIRRVGKSWFVQTPNRYFPIEPHSRLPLVQFLPRSFVRACLPYLKGIVGYQDELQWRLLGAREFAALFPQSLLIRERLFGLTKSLVVIGGERLRPEPETCPASQPMSPTSTA